MATYRGSYKGVGEMLTSEFIKVELLRRAEQVKAAAVATAPDYRPIGSGYITSFSVDVGVQTGKTRRAVATVTNDSPHAVIVEFGGRNTPKHRTMLKALAAARG